MLKDYLFLPILLLQVLLIDGKSFYDQPINDLIKQYDVRKVSAGHYDDYTTGCLLDYAYFKDSYRLIAIDLSNQKAWDVDSRVFQQIAFQGVVGRDDGTKIRLYIILKKLKETVLEFYSKSSVNSINGWIQYSKC